MDNGHRASGMGRCIWTSLSHKCTLTFFDGRKKSKIIQIRWADWMSNCLWPHRDRITAFRIQVLCTSTIRDFLVSRAPQKISSLIAMPFVQSFPSSHIRLTYFVLNLEIFYDPSWNLKIIKVNGINETVKYIVSLRAHLRTFQRILE